MADGNTLSPSEPPRYRAYLLRLWAVDSGGQPVWRGSLQDTHTGERHGFADLAQLTSFLQEVTYNGDRSQKDAGKV